MTPELMILTRLFDARPPLHGLNIFDTAYSTIQSINQSTREREQTDTLQPKLLLIDEYEFNKRQMDEGKIRKNTFLAQVTKKIQGEKHFTLKEISGRWKIL